MLFKKMLRTLRNYKAQFISMIIMIAIGVGVFAGFSGEWYTIKKDSEYFYNLDGFSDFRITNSLGFTESDLEKIKAIDGVDDATLYLNVETKTKDDDILDICTSSNMNVSGFTVIKGEEYNSESVGGIWLSDMYAKANKIKVDDYIGITFKGYDISLKVKGLVKSSEF